VILLDTHVVVWLALEPKRLSSRAAEVIQQNAGKGLAISTQSLYEVAWLIARGRIAVKESIEAFLESMAARFEAKPLTPQIAVTAAQLPPTFPSDPFDRIIAATAIVERVLLLTADKDIRRSRALRTLW
jgi:PIN domain nuclease of toxin-antitoxin system